MMYSDTIINTETTQPFLMTGYCSCNRTSSSITEALPSYSFFDKR